MKSQVRMKLVPKTPDGWYKWFAWYPVRVQVPIVNPESNEDRAYRYIWWEDVEWQYACWVDVYYVRYRLPQNVGRC